jgi:hypothetical protein
MGNDYIIIIIIIIGSVAFFFGGGHWPLFQFLNTQENSPSQGLYLHPE